MTPIAWVQFVSTFGLNILLTHAVRRRQANTQTDVYLGVERTDRQGAGEETLLQPPLVTAESTASYIHTQQREHRRTQQLLERGGRGKKKEENPVL